MIDDFIFLIKSTVNFYLIYKIILLNDVQTKFKIGMLACLNRNDMNDI